jgi:hypothetical protein
MRAEKLKNFLHPHTSYQKNALILLMILTILLAISCLWIWNPFDRSQHTGKPTAYIYQNGELIQKIELNTLQESYRFVITNDDGQWNELEVTHDSIGIVMANCPNGLCVSQGFISRSLLPITCLPHRLVIWMRYEQELSDANLPMDSITY